VIAFSFAKQLRIPASRQWLTPVRQFETVNPIVVTRPWAKNDPWKDWHESWRFYRPLQCPRHSGRYKRLSNLPVLGRGVDVAGTATSITLNQELLTDYQFPPDHLFQDAAMGCVECGNMDGQIAFHALIVPHPIVATNKDLAF